QLLVRGDKLAQRLYVLLADVLERVRGVHQHLHRERLGAASDPLQWWRFQAGDRDLGERVRLAQLILGRVQLEGDDGVTLGRADDLQVGIGELTAGGVDRRGDHA